MARTVNEQERALKRSEILDATQRLVYTKGYEQMAIQDILEALKISKGAFYHYFGSKQDLLEALVERMQQEAEDRFFPILQDPEVPALEKLQHFFDTTVRWKTDQKEYLLALLRVWYADDNALVRYKAQATMARSLAPLFESLVEQGVREGVLSNQFADQVGPMVIALSLSLGEVLARLIMAHEPPPDALNHGARIVAAYTDAIERVLGAPAGSLRLIDEETLHEWLGAPRSA
jgi:AcrR family transcriptional regulator